MTKSIFSKAGRLLMLFMLLSAMTALTACGSSDKAGSTTAATEAQVNETESISTEAQTDETESNTAAAQTDETEGSTIEAQTAEGEGDITNGDFSDYAGTYTSEDGDTITIGEDGSIDISLLRLCSMQGTAQAVYKSIMPITVTDPNENEMGLEFNTETKELIVVDSTWDLLENGTTYEMNK